MFRRRVGLTASSMLAKARDTSSSSSSISAGMSWASSNFLAATPGVPGGTASSTVLAFSQYFLYRYANPAPSVAAMRSTTDAWPMKNRITFSAEARPPANPVSPRKARAISKAIRSPSWWSGKYFSRMRPARASVVSLLARRRRFRVFFNWRRTSSSSSATSTPAFFEAFKVSLRALSVSISSCSCPTLAPAPRSRFSRSSANRPYPPPSAK